MLQWETKMPNIMYPHPIYCFEVKEKNKESNSNSNDPLDAQILRVISYSESILAYCDDPVPVKPVQASIKAQPHYVSIWPL